MNRTVDIALPPQEAADPALVREAAAEACSVKLEQVKGARVVKRSLSLIHISEPTRPY